MTGVGGKGRGAFCNLSSVFCLLVRGNPCFGTGLNNGRGESSAELLCTAYCILATCNGANLLTTIYCVLYTCLPLATLQLPHLLAFPHSFGLLWLPMDILPSSEVLNILHEATLAGTASVSGFSAWAPRIVAALVLLAVGVVAAYGIELLFIFLGQKLRLHVPLKKIGFDAFLERVEVRSKPIELLGKFFRGLLLTFFFLQISHVLGLTEVEEFFRKLLAWLPNLLVALLILLFSVQVAERVAAMLQGFLHLGDATSRVVLAAFAKNVVIAFGVMAALVQLRLAPELVTMLFGAFLALLALGGGLALGLGGQDFVRKFLADMQKKPKRAAPSSAAAKKRKSSSK